MDKGREEATDPRVVQIPQYALKHLLLLLKRRKKESKNPFILTTLIRATIMVALIV